MTKNFKFDKIANKTKLGDLIDVNALYMIRHHDIYVKTVSTNHTTIMTGEQFKHFCETELANSNQIAVKAAKIELGKETDKFFEYTCSTINGTVKDSYQYYIRLAKGEIKEEDCQWRASDYNKWDNLFIINKDLDFMHDNVIERDIMPFYNLVPDQLKKDVDQWLANRLHKAINRLADYIKEEMFSSADRAQKRVDQLKSWAEQYGIEY